MSFAPICIHCKNYIEGNKCKAFDKIPNEILNMTFDHHEPYPNLDNRQDRGIQFDPDENSLEKGSPICVRCKNYTEGNKCKAFDKIPNEILLSKFDHHDPYPNSKNPQDRGIQFELKKTEQSCVILESPKRIICW